MIFLSLSFHLHSAVLPSLCENFTCRTVSAWPIVSDRQKSTLPCSLPYTCSAPSCHSWWVLESDLALDTTGEMGRRTTNVRAVEESEVLLISWNPSKPSATSVIFFHLADSGGGTGAGLADHRTEAGGLLEFFPSSPVYLKLGGTWRFFFFLNETLKQNFITK